MQRGCVVLAVGWAVLGLAAVAPPGVTESTRMCNASDGALSIEGLASTPDGALLIGFRNPITDDGKALVARLKNPDQVVAGQPAEFGKPITLDLGGLGIRSMERRGDEYLIVAGRHGEG